MREQAGRLALAEAMQLHDQRVEEAQNEFLRLRDALERAEKYRAFTIKARDTFKAAILAQGA